MIKPLFFAATLILCPSAKLHATEALIFDGGGYNIQILVGHTDRPVVAEVRFTPPGVGESVSLTRDRFRIEKFDFSKRLLILHFARGKDTAMPASFSLSVKRDSAILSINGKKIRSTMDWDI